MPDFKNPSFSKIITNSSAKIIIESSKGEDFLSYEMDEDQKKNYQVFFMNDVLYVESIYPNQKPLEIKINKKFLSDIQCKLNSQIEIKNNANIKNISLYENSQVSIDRSTVESIDMYGESELKVKSISKIKKLSTYDNASASINKIMSKNLMISHNSKSILKIEGGRVESLVCEKNTGSEIIEINARIENADLLNNSESEINASFVEKSLTGSLIGLGGIKVRGKCEEFIHIKNDGDNEVFIEGIDTQRIHCINSKQSTTILVGKTDNLIYATQELSFAYLQDLQCSSADLSINETSMNLYIDKSLVGKVSNQSVLTLNAPDMFYREIEVDETSSLSILEINKENNIVPKILEDSEILEKEKIQEKIATLRDGMQEVKESNKRTVS